MSPSSDPQLPARRVVPAGVVTGATLLALAVGGCRADSIMSPGMHCEDPTDCTAVGVVSADMRDALDDANRRLVPALELSAGRTAVEVALQRLQDALDAQNLSAGRLALAVSYDALTRLSAEEAAEVSAIRLALAPLAAALGVADQGSL
jgi:hypothetical protein